MRLTRQRSVLVLLLTVGLFSTMSTAQDQKEQEPYPFVSGELLVRFKPGVGVATMAQPVPGAVIERTFEIVSNLQLIRLPAGADVLDAVRLYKQHPDVLYAQPNFLHHKTQQTHLTPDDTQFSSLYGLHNTGQTGGTPDADIDAPEAWDLSTGSNSVVVFVIDTGGDYNHEDLIANRWANPGEIAGNGLDDDGNGYIDDIYGIDTAYNDSDPMDGDGHGTHVSGTIGARGNNNLGVVGVNWQVTIGQCKFLNDSGSGSTADAIECLQYIRNLKVNAGVPVIATNNSWGGGPFEQALYDAIAEHMNQGILFIAAAGNDGTDNDAIPHYPSNYYLPNIISVAATDHDDALATFTIGASNYGLRTVHVGAPGKSILSTWPGNTYNTISGTSMATPHVTGLAALLKAHNPSRDWIAIRNLIFAGGDFKSSLDNKTVLERRINAFGSLSCSDSPVFGILRPFSTVGGGSPVTIAVINVNCASPAGALTVTINPGGTVVNLVDDGVAPDLAANDGIYSGTWNLAGNICQVGTYTLDFSNGQSTTVQVGGAQGSYHCTTPSMSWRTITGTNLSLGDDTWATVNPGFSVQFGTSSYSTVYVNANGLLSFTNNSGLQYNNQQLPYSSFTTLVAPFWDDLYPSGTSNVYWQALGSAPNREVVIEWRNVRKYECQTDPTATVRFQAVFFESSNQVLFNYQDVDFGGGCTFADKGASATVGVQVSTSDATQIGFNSQILNNTMAVQWSTVSPCTDTGAIFRVERTTGNACADGSWNPGGADVAEFISASEALQAGDLVEFDPHHPKHYRRTREPYSALVAGVISTRPGLVLGLRLSERPTPLAPSLKGMGDSPLTLGEGTGERSALLLSGVSISKLATQTQSERPLLALLGRVPVKATTENGPIRAGDLLTSSSKPGYAMRCESAAQCEGAIIGKALEALEEGEGVILMIVMR
jgi:subtilisin family serine protease